MSKKSNVNPDHYKTAGREVQGHDVGQRAERQKLRQEQAWLEEKAAGHQPATKAPEKHTTESSKDKKSSKAKVAEAEQAAANKKNQREDE